MRVGSKKAAVSPVLATILLIVVTLVAALAMSGFYFGLMGTFANTALVSAGGAGSCAGTPEVCTLTVTNSGSGNANLGGDCKMNFGGSSYQGTTSVVSGSLNAGHSATVSCTSVTPGAHATSGSSITGWLMMGWNLEILFSAQAD